MILTSCYELPQENSHYLGLSVFIKANEDVFKICDVLLKMKKSDVSPNVSILLDMTD